MIEYYEQLSEEEQDDIKHVIQTLYRHEVMDAGTLHITEETAFEKLILAYDYSTRKNSKYRVLNEEETVIQSGKYQYPALKFVRRRPQ